MVFGFGEGKMEIKTDKMSYTYSDTIQGTVNLSVSKPKKARRVYIEFFGEQEQNRTVHDAKGRVRTERDVNRIYSFTVDLDAEKEYLGNFEYKFEIKVPAVPPQPKLEGALGTVVGLASMMGGLPSPPRWFLRAALDVPMGVDISKQIQLNIG